MKRGFSLVEIMVAMSLFAILAVSTTVISAGILRAGLRSTMEAKVRSEGSYAMGAMSLVTRYAVQATCGVSGSTTWVDVSPRAGYAPARYGCYYDGTTGTYSVASGSASLPNVHPSLISDEVRVTGCAITCSGKSVNLSFDARDAAGLLTNPLSFDTSVTLRNQ